MGEPTMRVADERLAAIAVELLSPQRAIDLRLAGIFRLGVRARGQSTELPGCVDAMLVKAERREVAAFLSASRRTREALRALGAVGVRPVVLKGRSLAERLWPRPWMRPEGDLDLLVEERELALALPALVRLGLRPRDGGAPGRWRPTLAGVVLASPSSEDGVDLHSRLFRSVGSGIDTAEVLSRTRESELLGERVRLLDPADEVHFLLVHAAAHGAVHPKWLLDLHAAAIGYPPEVWRAAAQRARTTRTTRPFWAAARLLHGSEAGSRKELIRGLRPPLPVRAILGRLVFSSVRGPWPTRPRLHAYALEGALEERVRERVVRTAGVLARLGRRVTRPLARREGTPSRAEVASDRWIEGAWRDGRLGAVWLTLKGGSMAPAVRDGDRLLVAPLDSHEPPREGEIVIAKRAGRFVAHRLVATGREAVVTRGDACARDDPPLPREHILARVVAIDPLSIETR
jgi:putative nucleotidyltransferase-like protein/peptidase S24-like protein